MYVLELLIPTKRNKTWESDFEYQWPKVVSNLRLNKISTHPMKKIVSNKKCQDYEAPVNSSQTNIYSYSARSTIWNGHEAHISCRLIVSGAPGTFHKDCSLMIQFLCILICFKPNCRTESHKILYKPRQLCCHDTYTTIWGSVLENRIKIYNKICFHQLCISGVNSLVKWAHGWCCKKGHKPKTSHKREYNMPIS